MTTQLEEDLKRIRNLLQPIDYMEDFANLVHTHTIDTPWFTNAVKSTALQRNSLIWVNGGEGTGKTTLLLQAYKNLSVSAFCSVFLCDPLQSRPLSLHQILANVAYDLAKKFPECKEHMLRFVNLNIHILPPNDIFREIIQRGIALAKISTKLYYLIDSIDQIEINGLEGDFTHFLGLLLQSSSIDLPKVVVVLSGQLSSKFWTTIEPLHPQILEIPNDEILNDLREYISSAGHPVEPLLSNSEGVFLYAKIACEYLSLYTDTNAAAELIRRSEGELGRLPNGVRPLFKYIVHSIGEIFHYEDVIRKFLTVICSSSSPVSVASICELSEIPMCTVAALLILLRSVLRFDSVGNVHHLHKCFPIIVKDPDVFVVVSALENFRRSQSAKQDRKSRFDYNGHLSIPTRPISLSMSEKSRNSLMSLTFNENASIADTETSTIVDSDRWSVSERPSSPTASFTSIETLVNSGSNNRLRDSPSTFETDDNSFNYERKMKETQFTQYPRLQRLVNLPNPSSVQSAGKPILPFPRERDLLRRDLGETRSTTIKTAITGGDSNVKEWERLDRDITTAVNDLNQSAKENTKEKFVPQSALVVESVRVMLYAAGAQNLSPKNPEHRSLKQNHKEIMVSLSELVLQAKNASAARPQPDSKLEMEKAANDVLVAVRKFSTAAKEVGIKVKNVEGVMSAVPDTPVEISKDQLVRSASQTTNVPTITEEIIPTFSELPSQLDTQTTIIQGMISTLVDSYRAPDFVEAQLVPQVRAIVKEVGNFLAVVDEIPLDYLNEEDTVEFKVNRLALYNSISGLVMATQTATSQYAVSNAVEHVILSTGLVEKAVKDLLISAKFLIEEQESVEQEKLLFIRNVEIRSSDTDLHKKSPDPQVGQSNFTLKAIFESGREDDSEMDKEAEMNRIKKFFGVSNSEKSDKPSYLGYDYGPSDLVFSSDGKVIGGTLEALVERLTAHDTSDLNHMSAFLLTFRSFCSSSQLFELLLKRYTLQPPAGLTPEQLETWRRDKLDTIRTRVYNVLKNWIEKYWLNDEDDNTTLIRIREMAETLIKSYRDAEGLRIVALCNQRAQAGEGGLIKPLKHNNISQTPTPIVPRSLKRIKFLELDPLEVARQLTIMVSRIYERIQPVELLKKAWVEQDNSVAINARTMIAVSNQITGWVVHTILNEKKVRERSYYIRLFIAIAEKCRRLNNFDTLMAILCGLEAAPIHRLKRTWELIKSREMSTFESLRTLMTSTENYSKYREELESCIPPCIPFLELYLNDLTVIEDRSPDVLKNTNLINFAKRMKTAEIIRDLQQYQLPFEFVEVKELQMFLKNSLEDGNDDIDRYEISCELEPKESEEGKITRLLTESGYL
ncbi:hypothetical protein HK098_008319 [Nowakowskiella sp. JEL0407]|nr:hypothetical protein HK098_008319 [Nowakowskiella sp. JEL0407]